MNEVRYVGKNGMEYLLATDAELYGGGLVKKVSVMGELIERVQLTAAEKRALRAKKSALADVTFEVNGTFTDPDDTEEVELPPTDPVDEDEGSTDEPETVSGQKKGKK